MNIPWEEQPTPEHVWIAADSEKNSGWHIKEGDRYYAADNRYWRACDNNDLYKVHHRPEPEFKQGDLVDVIYDDKDGDNIYGAEIIYISGKMVWVQYGSMDSVVYILALRKHETEREKFANMALLMGGDPLTREVARKLYDAGFRYTGDKE